MSSKCKKVSTLDNLLTFKFHEIRQVTTKSTNHNMYPVQTFLLNFIVDCEILFLRFSKGQTEFHFKY